MSRRKNNAEDGIFWLFAVIIVAAFFLPIYGMFKVVKAQSDEDKTKGVGLLILGLIIWFILLIAAQ